MTNMEKKMYGYFLSQGASLMELPEGGFAITSDYYEEGEIEYTFKEEENGLIKVTFPWGLTLYGDVANIGNIVDHFHKDEDGDIDYDAY